MTSFGLFASVKAAVSAAMSATSNSGGAASVASPSPPPPPANPPPEFEPIQMTAIGEDGSSTYLPLSALKTTASYKVSMAAVASAKKTVCSSLY